MERSHRRSARYREIVGTLARHGIGVVGNERIRAEHLRQACEDLGTVFIKLGQMLSTRGDLLPETYRTELSKLQDEVPPVSLHDVEEVIRAEFGAPVSNIFPSFDPAPAGSASIAQVHNATLPDGRHVVVKVRKPGVKELAFTDLELLSDVVESWTPRSAIFQQFDAPGLLRDFGDTLRAELDFRREAANQRVFRDIFRDERGFKIPGVIEPFSGEAVLTYERIDGVSPEDIAALSNRRRSTVAARIARFVVEPALEHGVLYADPHPGNFIVQDGGVLGVVDFGMVERLTPEARRRVADLLIGISRCDAERVTDRLIEIAAPSHPVDRAAIGAEMEHMLKQYVDVSFESVPIGNALGELLELFRRERLRLPPPIAQLFKAMLMCEGLLQRIDPEAGLSDFLEPLAGKLMHGGLTDGRWGERVRESVADAAELSVALPRRIDRVLGEVERGNLRVWTAFADAEPLVKRFEHMVERANATMLAAACIVGIAIVMQFYHPQGWRSWIGAVFWIAVAAAVASVVRTLFGLRR